MTDEFGNDAHDIKMVAIAARARGDCEAERLALDRLAVMEREELAYRFAHQEETRQGAIDELVAAMDESARGLIGKGSKP